MLQSKILTFRYCSKKINSSGLRALLRIQSHPCLYTELCKCDVCVRLCLPCLSPIFLSIACSSAAQLSGYRLLPLAFPKPKRDRDTSPESVAAAGAALTYCDPSPLLPPHLFTPHLTALAKTRGLRPLSLSEELGNKHTFPQVPQPGEVLLPAQLKPGDASRCCCCPHRTPCLCNAWAKLVAALRCWEDGSGWTRCQLREP